jgi:acetolactate synthase-1/2/3 large subunit
MPFLTTAKAKGTMDELHPLFVGTASGMAGDEAILRILDECDVLVGVGFDPVECDKDWFVGRRFVCVDETSHAEAGYQPEIQVIGDIDALLHQLAERIACQHIWTTNEVRLRRDKVAMTVAPRSTPQMGLSPYAVLQRLQDALPENGILACDVGSHKLLVGQVWRSRCSGSFLMSNGLSAMGYGLSAAIAAGLEYPDRPVLCVTGDGGFLMGLHNLELMVRRRVPIVVAVYTDQILAAIKIAQARRGLPSYGVDFGRPDYAAIAQAFGAVGRRIEQLDEVIPACRDAVDSRVPSVLDISIDPREYCDQT